MARRPLKKQLFASNKGQFPSGPPASFFPKQETPRENKEPSLVQEKGFFITFLMRSVNRPSGANMVPHSFQWSFSLIKFLSSGLRSHYAVQSTCTVVWLL